MADDDKGRHATDQVAHDLIHLTQFALVREEASVASAVSGLGSEGWLVSS
jgi:hypothetical protein